MKEFKKVVYIVSGNEKEIEKETLEQAQDTKGFLEEMINASFTIEQRQKSVFEIEKGDKVYWLKDGKPDTSRIDIITDVVKNTWGDKQFLTKELNGNRIGSAYESYLCLTQ